MIATVTTQECCPSSRAKTCLYSDLFHAGLLQLHKPTEKQGTSLLEIFVGEIRTRQFRCPKCASGHEKSSLNLRTNHESVDRFWNLLFTGFSLHFKLLEQIRTEWFWMQLVKLRFTTWPVGPNYTNLIPTDLILEESKPVILRTSVGRFNAWKVSFVPIRDVMVRYGGMVSQGSPSLSSCGFWAFCSLQECKCSHVKSSICLTTYISLWLFVCLSVCLSIYLSYLILSVLSYPILSYPILSYLYIYTVCLLILLLFEQEQWLSGKVGLNQRRVLHTQESLWAWSMCANVIT